MSKIKLSKSELKKQRDGLKQYLHYLPTLQLKKQQLQMKILEARGKIEKKSAVLRKREEQMERWVGLLADGDINLKRWITPAQIIVDSLNVAGASIPVLKEARFDEPEYDFYATPFWVDRAIIELKVVMTILVEMDIIQRQIVILERELRITTQRVNLFEKVKIPECRENIRRIGIYLGDQQANAVGVSKVAKRKVLVREVEEAGV